MSFSDYHACITVQCPAAIISLCVYNVGVSGDWRYCYCLVLCADKYVSCCIQGDVDVAKAMEGAAFDLGQSTGNHLTTSRLSSVGY